MNVVKKSYIKKILGIVFFSIVCGLFVSLGWSAYQYCQSDNYRGKVSIDDQCIKCDKNIKTDAESDVYQISEKGGKIIITFSDGAYINKMQYEYTTAVSAERNSKIKITTRNIYGDNEVKEIRDSYFSELSRSVININAAVTKMEFQFPKGNESINIKNFIIDNSFKWNPYLFGIVVVCVFLLLFLIVFREENIKNPGRATFICVFIVGCCVLILQPPFFTGWDEEIHFSNSYQMAITREPGGNPNVLFYLRNNGTWFHEHNQISVEERVDLIRNMNRLGTDYGLGVMDYNFALSSIGYIFQAISITIGKCLNLPFYIVWLLGKFANVLLYSAGMGLAVAIIPIGKKLFAVLALMPTFIFMSTVYTYDVTVNTFIVLSICIFLRELLNRDMLFENKWRILYLGSMMIGCMPKAVYAPLLLNVFFLPKDKFRSSRDERLFKVGVLLVCLALMSTFIFPTLLNPSSGGDARGGDTSVASQLSYVLGQPFAYAVILLKNIGETIVPYMLQYSVESFAYCGTAIYPFLYSALLVGVVLTDTYSVRSGQIITAKNRIVAMLSIFATISLIWTALYLSFTEIGETQIAGVQARYYLPFLFLFYLCFRTGKIKIGFKEKNYQMVVMILSCGLLMLNVFNVLFLDSCL